MMIKGFVKVDFDGVQCWNVVVVVDGLVIINGQQIKGLDVLVMKEVVFLDDEDLLDEMVFIDEIKF